MLLHPRSSGSHIGAELLGLHLIAMLAAEGEAGFVVAGLQVRGGAPEGADGEGRIPLLRQTIRHAAHPAVHAEHLRQHQHRRPRRFRPGPPRRHGALGGDHLSPGRLNRHLGQGVCRDCNCHRRQSSVRWPRSVVPIRFAVPHSAGQRHPGIEPAVQPDLLRDRRAPLSAGASITEHAPAGDANRPAPQHDQQGVSAAGK